MATSDASQAAADAGPAERRLTIAAIAALVLGIALMIPFEATITRLLGVACLFAFIVLGAFAIARPERIERGDGKPSVDPEPVE